MDYIRTGFTSFREEIARNLGFPTNISFLFFVGFRRGCLAHGLVNLNPISYENDIEGRQCSSYFLVRG